MKRILVAQFFHETNSFSPKKGDTTAFKKYVWHEGQEMIEKQRYVASDLGGFVDYVLTNSDAELIPTIGLEAPPSGPVTENVYNFALNNILSGIKNNLPLDGVFIHFHGAMVAENHQDAEGDIAEKVREVIGYDIPLMCSLDLHANVTKKMAKQIDVLVPYDCYPHTDVRETGALVARIMLDTLEGKIKPTMAFKKVPFLLPLFCTDEPAIKPLYDKAFEMRERSGVVSARFAHGFAPSDIEELGMSVLVITDNNKSYAEELASELEDNITARIPYLTNKYPTLDEALDRVLLDGAKPVVIADSSDNPGAGGFGDTTHILKRVLERKITGAVFATILDPQSVIKCEQAGVGNYVELDLGGKSDKEISGGPVRVNAYVKMLTDGNYTFKGRMGKGLRVTHGKAAVIEVLGNFVIVTSLPRQPYDLEVFRSHGITPEEMKLLVVKSSVHFRDDYGKIAREMHTLALKGYASPDPKNYNYKNYKGKV
ncbi:MAG: M81 family metallopeptidase [Clostridia bacterium]|nr:M81 family metallopeptidase [Clostridia bacterium]